MLRFKRNFVFTTGLFGRIHFVCGPVLEFFLLEMGLKFGARFGAFPLRLVRLNYPLERSV